MTSQALVWLRRDLRCHDHAPLHDALRRFERVHCVFVFDTDILDTLPTRCDRRVEFIHASVLELHGALRALAAGAGVPGGGLLVRHGPALASIVALARSLGVREVLASRDYEPGARERDARVAEALRAHGIALRLHKDQALFECDELLTGQGRPYSVFTPYKRAWLARLDGAPVQGWPIQPHAQRLAPLPPGEPPLPTLADLGFAPTNLGALPLPTGMRGARLMLHDFARRLGDYHQARDYPARKGVSCLSVHLRFGTLSIREAAALARGRAAQGDAGAQAWLAELCWRDFYFMLLWHHPHSATRAFRPAYDQVQWDDDPALWQAWRQAGTGYPLVDAALRQLHRTGYMHNRLRMLVASFLTKDLGLDWRLGERHFAEHLNDYDLAANAGGWQWAASTGCDAQPWFRIFNPVTQSRKFDPEGQFIRRYLPELARLPDTHIHFPAAMPEAALQACGVRLGVDYPHPVVDHARARQRTLMRFHFVKVQAGDALSR